MSEGTSSATIMVVDDTPENLDLLRELLQKEGYRVQVFPRGALALKAALTRPPDLILLDIMMPEMNGFEVCERLKADAVLKEIPVLFLSALTETADKLKAFAAGGEDYVTKPFNFDEINARVRTHLELHRQRRELQEAYDRLRELETLRDNLTHMIVHDMRSPLMSIGGSYEMILMEQDRLSQWQMELLTLGQNSCRELIEMMSSLLDISRMEAGQMPLNRVVSVVRDIAQSAAQSAAVLTRENALTIRISGESASAFVDCDIIHRIFGNLLGNAIKFSPEGGVIDVGIAPVEGGVRVTVTDQGRGIPPEYHRQIFDKFGQVEARKEGQKHSSGMGLTFCKLAVEAHGGTIGIESEVGKGSTFWFILPTGGVE